MIQRRTQLAQELERLKGRKDQAERALKEIEAECRSKKIDPDKIDAVLEEMWARYRRMVPELEADIASCASKLAKYTSNVSR